MNNRPTEAYGGLRETPFLGLEVISADGADVAGLSLKNHQMGLVWALGAWLPSSPAIALGPSSLWFPKSFFRLSFFRVHYYTFFISRNLKIRKLNVKWFVQYAIAARAPA